VSAQQRAVVLSFTRRASPAVVRSPEIAVSTFEVTPPGPVSPAATPIARCCERHDDWIQLAEHLIAGFPDIDPGEIVDQLTRARTAAERFGLHDDDALDICERMARHQLLIQTGHVPASARLDPESHERRKQQR
jgi:hypothetical protein